MHGAVVVERHHAAHALVYIVAVNANEQHHDRRNGGPDNFQRQIAFDSDTVGQIAGASAESNQAEQHEADDSKKKNRTNAEENLEQGVVNRGVAAGVERQQLNVLTHPKAHQHKDHAEQQGDQGRGDGQVDLSISVHPMDFGPGWRVSQ